jgi:serine/threonine protein kinase
MLTFARHRRRLAPPSRSSSCTGGADWGPSEPPLAPGAVLVAGYEVVAHLRRGRRLDVYDVWDQTRTCRCIAKTLRPERADDAVAVDRLRTEGELLGAIAHPHLVRAYATATTLDRPRPGVILETLPGHTVDHLIGRHGRLRGGDVALLGMQLASAVAHLHHHGWLHLDIKPANVINTAGRAVLLDLSLATRVGEHCAGGTFDYLSPEQARGETATEATDVWGLGATLYEALGGSPPFAAHAYRRPDGQRRYPQAELTAPPLRTRRRSHRGLAEAIDACLRPAPTDRPNLSDLTALLAAWSGIDLRHFGT